MRGFARCALILPALLAGACAAPADQRTTPPAVATSDGGGNIAPASRTSHAALTGQWNGSHAALTLTADGGSIEFNCGRVTLDGALVPGADGTFAVAGQRLVQTGRPRPGSDEPLPPITEPVAVSGRVQDGRMQLRVDQAGQSVAVFNLQRGGVDDVANCQ